VWDPETPDRYLADPRAAVSATKMAFPGKDAAERADLIACLATLKWRPCAIAIVKRGAVAGSWSVLPMLLSIAAGRGSSRPPRRFAT
jgi:hypothetical protein